jgi:hypothetical protein
MSAVVKFEVTKRKLDWKQEEELRQGKKKGATRREQRKASRDLKAYQEEDVE